MGSDQVLVSQGRMWDRKIRNSQNIMCEVASVGNSDTKTEQHEMRNESRGWRLEQGCSQRNLSQARRRLEAYISNHLVVRQALQSVAGAGKSSTWQLDACEAQAGSKLEHVRARRASIMFS